MVVHIVTTGLQNVRGHSRQGSEIQSSLKQRQIQTQQHSLDDMNHATSQAYAGSDIDNVQSTCCGVRS
jgi:hypothetical protein